MPKRTEPVKMLLELWLEVVHFLDSFSVVNSNTARCSSKYASGEIPISNCGGKADLLESAQAIRAMIH